MSEGYNGWKNYATWLVNLHYTNNEYDNARLEELAQDQRDEYDDAYPDNTEGIPLEPLDEDERAFVRGLVSDLADNLKDMVESDVEELLNDNNIIGSFINDAINATMSDIDWREWAENLLEV